ncbi:MAG: hypothetical protein QM758_23620 [Armatimonas sp.]
MKPTPAQSGPIVLGTEQLPGDFGKLGQTYTIGKYQPINITLKSAAYTIEPFVAGQNTWVPKADEKILLLHFTAHNPNPSEFPLSWSSLKLTAVDQTDTNRKSIDAMVRQGATEPLNVSLKPAQKIDVTMAIVVPASGVVPKLIVQRDQDSAVVRYDLHEKVAKLPAYMADEADPTGASVRKQVPAQPGTFYPLGVYDTRLDSVGTVDGKLLNREPGEDKEWFTAIFTIKNRTASKQRYVWSDFVPELKDSEGEKPRWTQAILKATRDEQTYGELEPGEEAKIRFFFALPKGVSGKTLTLAEARLVHPTVARPFVFDLTSAPHTN